VTASALWTAVEAAYDEDGLVTLTNIRDRSATTIDTTVGQNAAQEIIDLWPYYTHATYDATDSGHVAVAKHGVIALLWRRGGTAAAIAEVKWSEWEGMVARVKTTGARGHVGPSSNSGVTQASELASGQRVRGWSDRESLPPGFLPSRKTVSGG